MVLFRTTLLALASALVASADYWVEPDTVPLQDRLAWCKDQKSVCPIICLQTTTDAPTDNSCDPDKLTYGCVCSDGKQPNMTEFTITLPFHMCTEWGTQCVKACGSDSECAYDCRANHPCGAQNPSRAANSTTSSTTAATQTATTSSLVYGGFNGESQDSNGNAAGALRFGDSYSLAIVAGGLFAGFAMLL